LVIGAAPRRSTSSLDAMPRVLLWLSRKSPISIFAMTWIVFLLGVGLNSNQLPWPARVVGAVLSTTIIFGYPFVIIFGFPAPYSSVASKRTSILSVLAVVTACVASVANWHTAPEAVDTWLGKLFGLIFALLLFSPFFVATHVLGEARRTLGVYKPLDSIGAWVSLFYFGFGGVFFLHRSVANAAGSIATEGRIDKGIRDATVV
jgi:hypothetical protein